MRALILSSDSFEDSGFIEPLEQLRVKGVSVDIAAPHKGTITGKHRHTTNAGLALGTVQAEDYDLLLLPGGEAPARLRNIPEAMSIVRRLLLADKPVAAICHGPQLLIATGLMEGRSATCYRAVREELEAARANYLDHEVVVDGKLVTSRQPSDILAFMGAIFSALGLSP